MSEPHYSAARNEHPDDGWYINRYYHDEQGMTRRDTVYDGMLEHQAVSLAKTLNVVAMWEVQS